MNDLGLYKSSKNEGKRIALFDTMNFWTCLELKLKARTKTGIPAAIFQESRLIWKRLRNDIRTKELFVEKEGKEIFYQPKLVFNLNGKDVKCMYDMVIIDHVAKTIHPYDLKVTSFHTKEFPKVYIKHRYYIQSGLYSKGIESIVNANKFDFLDYTILPFTFVVYSVPDGIPMLWEIPTENVEKSIDGYMVGNHYKVKGIMDLISEYEYYKKNPECSVPYEFKDVMVAKLNVLGC